VYLRTTTKLHLTKDTHQYTHHVLSDPSQFTWSPQVVTSWLLACNLRWRITTPYLTQDFKAANALINPWRYANSASHQWEPTLG
jgi:hypothetical protein